MRIAITTVVQNSTFSGGINTTAMFLYMLLQELGHDLTLLNNTSSTWFQDNNGLRTKFNVVHTNEVLSGGVPKFDVVVECAWNMTGDLRARIAERCIVVLRKPPLMHDLESSVYPIRHGNDRGDNVHGLWIIAPADNCDVSYLKLLYPHLAIEVLPLIWYPTLVDGYVREFSNSAGMPEWPGAPYPVQDWTIHMMESNRSIGSHCVLPLIVCRDLVAAGTRRPTEAFKFSWKAHCSEPIRTKEYFLSNIFKNQFPMDMSKNLVSRIAMPVLRFSRSCVLTHQRFSPYRPLHLDTLWCGIPIVHNSPIFEAAGIDGGYSYPGNHISGAVDALMHMNADFHSRQGFFAEGAASSRKAWITANWIPTGNPRIMNAYRMAIGRIGSIIVSKPAPVPLLATKPIEQPSTYGKWADHVQWPGAGAESTDKDKVPMQRLVDVFPEELSGRKHKCGAVCTIGKFTEAQLPANIATAMNITYDVPLRECRFAVAIDGKGVVMAKAAGCVPVYCGVDEEIRGLCRDAIVCGGVWPQTVDLLSAADTSRRSWIALAIKPLYDQTIGLPAPAVVATPTPVPTGQPLPVGITGARLINMDRRPDRLERFNKTHPDMVGQIVRRSAVDGRALKLTNKLRRLFANNQFNWKKGVIGCNLSHYYEWEELAADPNPDAAKLMTEDDGVLKTSWRKTWSDAHETIPKDKDIIYLGGVLPPNKPGLAESVAVHPGGYATFIPSRSFTPPGQPMTPYFHMCTYAYVIRRSGARKLMDWIKLHGFTKVVDHMLCDNHSMLNLALVYPLIASCYQDADPTYANANFNDYGRSDAADTDCWNNDDRFTPEEIAMDLTEIDEPDPTSTVPVVHVVPAVPAISTASDASVPKLTLSIPPGLHDGMDLNEAYAVIRSHNSKSWDAYFICRRLGMDHHAYLTACDALARCEFSETTHIALQHLVADLEASVDKISVPFLKTIIKVSHTALAAAEAMDGLRDTTVPASLHRILALLQPFVNAQSA